MYKNSHLAPSCDDKIGPHWIAPNRSNIFWKSIGCWAEKNNKAKSIRRKIPINP